MTGKINLYRAKIKQGRRKIFFHFILLAAFIFYGRNDRATVNDRNIKLFHNERKGTLLTRKLDCTAYI